MNCLNAIAPILYIYSNDPNVPALLYYTHIPVAIISLLFGIFVYRNGKDSAMHRILFYLTVAVAVLAISNVFIWVNINVPIITFFWDLNKVMYFIIPFLGVYVFYYIALGRDISRYWKFFGYSIIYIYSVFTFSRWSLDNFDIGNCALNDKPFLAYIQTGFFLLCVGLLIAIFIRARKIVDTNQGKAKTIVFISMLCFLINLGSIYQYSYFAFYFDPNQVAYNYEMYALVGLPIFIGALAFAIVRYKLMNIKLFGIQAMVVALMAFIGSEFFFSQSIVNTGIITLTFIITTIVGINLVKSVKKEIKAREEIEVLARNLDRRNTELKIVNDNQDNLMHVMNHQIKGFLGMAKNIFAELLTSDDYGHLPETSKPILKHGLDITDNGVKYVQSILKGVSSLSGTLPYDMKPVDVKPIVLDLIAQQKDVAEKSPFALTFESHVADGDYNMIGDSIQLTECLKNIITNGIKYNNPHGILKVDLFRRDDKIVFEVKDSGDGVSEDVKPRLFTSGGMSKDSPKKNVEASGFGLAFVKGVVEAHKGIVGFRSNEPEKGSTFFIELPGKI